MINPIFTVFTPTYNRAHTLRNVYDSLLSQTLKNFEWLIVDDGSADQTKEIIQSFIDEKYIKIRYFQQSNGGKHVAFNRGVVEAKGDLFLTLDSDDGCIPTALERFYLNWLEIPEPKRKEFSGITCLCKDELGCIVGSELPKPILEGFPYEIVKKYIIKGEKWGFHKTAILRNYPFPVFPTERYVAESLVWNRIGLVYKIKFINEALRIYVNSSDGLSRSVTKLRQSNPNGTMLYYAEAILMPGKFTDKLKAYSNLWRFAFHSKKTKELVKIRRKNHLLIIGFIVGAGLFFLDRWKSQV